MAEELSAFAFWTLVDTDLRGWVDLTHLQRLMICLRFHVEPFTPEQLEIELGAVVEKGELSEAGARFDAVRQIFLAHNL